MCRLWCSANYGWRWQTSSFGQSCQWLSEAHYSCLLHSRRWRGPLYVLFRFHHFSSYTSCIAHGRFAPYSGSVLLWFLICCVFLLMCGIVAIASFWVGVICSFIYLGCAQLGCAGLIAVLFAFPCYIALLETEGPDPPQHCPLTLGRVGVGGGVTGPWGLFLSPGCQPVLLENKRIEDWATILPKRWSTTEFVLINFTFKSYLER